MGTNIQLHLPRMSSYRDYANTDFAVVKQQMDNEVPKCKRKGPRGGVTLPFPVRLYNMLQRASDEKVDDIVSWQPHGRAFILRNPREFARIIMSRFFHQTKLTSFHRQLNLYGFRRLTKGSDCGAYYHDLFLRGRPELCTFIVRTRSKGYRQEEPNLWSFPVCGVQHDMVSANTVPIPGKVIHEMDKEPTGYHHNVGPRGLKESVLKSHVTHRDATHPMDNGRTGCCHHHHDGRTPVNKLVLASHVSNGGAHHDDGIDVDIISDNDLRQVLDGWSDNTDTLDDPDTVMSGFPSCSRLMSPKTPHTQHG